MAISGFLHHFSIEKQLIPHGDQVAMGQATVVVVVVLVVVVDCAGSGDG